MRRLLCVFPRYAPSFGSFEFSYPLTDGVRAFMPPQGLLVIAAAAPRTWQIRFIDENIDPARIEMLTAHGFVERDRDGSLRVTPSGFPVLDAVVADLAA